MQAVLARIDAVNPVVNAYVTVARESALAAARRATRAAEPEGHGAPAAPRRAGVDQGSVCDQGDSHDVGVAHLQGPRPRRRRPRGPTSQGGRGHRGGQDEHSRVRGRREHVQCGVRRYPQPVESRAHLWRLERRRRGGRGHGHGPRRAGLGPRRLAPSPGGLLRGRRLPHHAGSRPVTSPDAGLGHPRRHRTDRAHGRRRRAHALGDGRPRRPGPALLRGRHEPVHPRGEGALDQGLAGCLDAGSGWADSRGRGGPPRRP